MLTLYYSPGACSMAPHIALEEAGADFRLEAVSLANGEQQSPAYLSVNPHGKVPALVTDRGVLTEAVAILAYVARSFPEAGLLPEEPLEMARCLSHMAYLSNTVHPAFTHIVRPGRFATDPAAHDSLRETGRRNAWGFLQEMDALLAGGEWVLGQRYSVADPYTLVIYGWGRHNRMPVEQLTHYSEFKDRMSRRPAVQRVIARERSPNWQS